jgi:hypothetical protein
MEKASACRLAGNAYLKRIQPLLSVLLINVVVASQVRARQSTCAILCQRVVGSPVEVQP